MDEFIEFEEAFTEDVSTAIIRKASDGQNQVGFYYFIHFI